MRRPGEAGKDRGGVLWRMVTGLLGTEADPRVAIEAKQRAIVVQRLLALYVIQATGCDDASYQETPIEFVQFSANVPCDVDPSRVTADQKLTGLQLHHFGAFLKESWRANDWMWGRLDGAGKLVQVLLQPDRFARIADEQADGNGDAARRWAYEQVMALATGWRGDEPASADPALLQQWRSFSDAVWNELAYVADESQPVPASLPCCSRGSHTGGTSTSVVTSCRRSPRRCGGAPTTEEQRRATRSEFVRSVPATGEALTTAAVPALLVKCKVSKETLGDEIGGDLFTRTASTALAVTTNALHAEKRLGPLRHLFQYARSGVLAVWLFAQTAAKSSRTSFAATTSALVFAGGVIAVAILGVTVPPILLIAAVVALALWCFAAALVTKSPIRVFGPILSVVVLVAITQIDRVNAAGRVHRHAPGEVGPQSAVGELEGLGQLVRQQRRPRRARRRTGAAVHLGPESPESFGSPEPFGSADGSSALDRVRRRSSDRRRARQCGWIPSGAGSSTGRWQVRAATSSASSDRSTITA